MSDPVMKLQTLTRAELALAQLRLHRTLARTVWLVGAGLVGLASLVMLEVAAYGALVPSQGPAIAALIIAALNAVIALILVAIAQRIGMNDGEAKLAQQMRDLAAADVNADVDRVRADIEAVSHSVRRLQSGLTSIPGTTGFGIIAAIFNLLFRSRRRR